MCFHLDMGSGEYLFEQETSRTRCEVPVLTPPVHVVPAQMADAGACSKQDAARLQHATEGLERCPRIVDELKGLCEDDAVKGLPGNMAGIGQVCHDRRPR